MQHLLRQSRLDRPVRGRLPADAKIRDIREFIVMKEQGFIERYSRYK